jgi:CRP-like cAMP-binding protein
MPGDFIVRRSEYADYFYIMKFGFAEVLASDWVTRITTITKGDYFGEIGILI